MKKLIYILLTLLILTACIGRREYAAMRHGLDSLNERNRNDEPFTAADVQPYIDYFDRHGEPNDRLLAYYLLGRAYHEQGEAPMALEQYHKAIECADTLSRDCDFGQLSRVYAQMGAIYFEQSLYRQHLEFEKKSEHFAWVAKDTLTALICYEKQSVAYDELGLKDSALCVVENVAQLYVKYGYPFDAAIALGSIVHLLINEGENEKAENYLKLYESESGLFNSEGEIEKGREAYYNSKGLFYLKTNCLDSAEYWYRKELRDGKDFNNQNGGAMGLAMVFEQRHQPDSAAKYYQYAYAMNDSMYAQMATEEVARMQAMYDYSRHQQIAHAEKEKASRRAIVIWVCIGIIVLLSLVAIIIVERINHRHQQIVTKYLESLNIIRQARQDIKKLKANNKENAELIAEKEMVIHEQKDFLKALPTDSLIYKRFSIRGKEPSTDEWLQIEELVFELFPQFQKFMADHNKMLNDKEQKTCLLILAGFKPKNISDMLNVGPSYISNIRSEMLQKLFGQTGTPKDFDRLLRDIS